MSIFKDKTLLITGGTGSFGNMVLKRFLESDIKEIRIFSRDEKKQDDMRHHLQAIDKEVVWVDWVKFICIVCVYWCHVGQLGNNPCPVSIPYGPFFVNAFFFVSGYLIFRKQLGTKVFSFCLKEYFKSNTSKNGMLTNMFWRIAIPSALFSMIDYLPKRIVGGAQFQ